MTVLAGEYSKRFAVRIQLPLFGGGGAHSESNLTGFVLHASLNMYAFYNLACISLKSIYILLLIQVFHKILYLLRGIGIL